MNYTVTDPKGVLIDGKVYEKGKTLPGSATSSQVRAFLRFKQIKPAEEEKEVEPKEPEPKEPSTVEELRAALEKRGIQIPEGAKKADLEKLYADSQPDLP